MDKSSIEEILREGVSFNNTIKIRDTNSGGGSSSSSGDLGSTDHTQNSEQEQKAETNILVYSLNINSSVYGLAISGNVYLPQKDSLVRVILVDSNGKEYLAYESYYLIADSSSFFVNRACEETCFLEGIIPSYLKIQLINSYLDISSVDYGDSSEKKSLRITNSISITEAIEESKIEKMNENIQETGMLWVAGETSISGLSYEDKKELFGVEDGEELPNLQGFEYYSGGIFEMPSEESSSSNNSTNSIASEKSSKSWYQKSAPSDLPDEWDWRNVSGENWNTDVKCQDGCFINLTLNCSIAESQCTSLGGLWKTSASCTAFSAAAATEILVNLYYNQHINIDLSEQESISYNCARGSYALNCERNFEDAKIVINDYASRGAIPEDCFPYFKYQNGSIPSSSNNINTINYSRDKCQNSNFTLFIGGADQFLFDTATQSDKQSFVTQDQLKQILIENGSVAVNDINSLSHAMALIGYGKVKNEIIIYTYPYSSNNSYDIIVGNDSRINKTFWIFKNSFGDGWGEGGYIRMVADSDVNLSSFSVKSVIPLPTITFQNRSYTISVTDDDVDGYCNWGISPQPLFNGNYTFYNTTACKQNAGIYLRDCDDSNNNLGGFYSNYSCMLIDRTFPSLNITSPENTTYNETISAMNYTLIEINPSACWYFNGTANNTVTCGQNITTNLRSNDGSNTWIIYANDTSGNMNSSSVTFFVDTCVPNMTYTDWSNWINESCFENQMNQSKFRTQYDSNNCYVQTGLESDNFPNVTYYNSTLVGPILQNTTTWTDWTNMTSCLFGDYYTQSKNLTQFDIYSCALNTTFFEYRNQTCDFCTPSLSNATTNWMNISCLFGDKMNQTKNIIQYDINSCGEIENQTFIEYQAIESCDFCIPNMTNTSVSSWTNLTCFENQMNQSQFFIEYDNNICGEIINVTHYNYQLLIAPSQSCTVGVGVCQSTGTQYRTCNGTSGWGDWGSCSVSAGTPGTESCNNLDDDCDGTIDNGLTVPSQICYAGVGACRNSGIEYKTCNGVSGWSTTYSGCTAIVGSPGIETCNNIDDDCDGSTDETLTAIFDCSQTGYCSGAFKTCSAGNWGGCSKLPQTEYCNGVDDNCDGTVDNGLTAPSQSCTVGVGACQRTGTQYKNCNGVSGWSSWGACSVSAGTPTAESCDNIDNDCDGSTDEGLTQSQSCSVDVTACSKAGSQIRTCSSGSWGSWGRCSPTTECSETDYGNDIYTYGVTKGILLGGQYIEHADRCIVTTGGGGGYWVSSCTGANCAVDEAYCRCCEQSDGANCGTNMYGKYFVHTFPFFAPCPNGCANGRCL